ncbi:FAD binding domain-containing protein [Sporosarcina highlanderae]|uniref:FAD binding domain-containing protein n=1 Tax=Sporosarcina highlanderae TaxID=3035916 RepID=A0ABT8JR42_9BACL|nr:FAD binding domain-containing protein [Sporosarcina highlanderae]MDN4607615.1 FAD binding domain-containing protein [Sporosarcina highlanderae]
MISFDFEYFKPESIDEAIKTFSSEWKLGKKVVYFSGGTEIITFSRGGKLTVDTVIDLKGIPECKVLEIQGDRLIIGAAVTLNQLIESNLFPLLSETTRRIADHTSRNKITIGGNLMSQLGYREGLLPLLVADAVVTVANQTKIEEIPIEKFSGSELKEGAFLTQIKVPVSNLKLPSKSIKRTRTSKVGYPIVSLAALVHEGKIRVAFSGINSLPFRSTVIESILNDKKMSDQQRIDKAITKLPSTITDDLLASKGFRQYTFGKMLIELNSVLEEKL